MSFQIDYKNEVLYGVLQRMAPSIGNSQPILREYWICNIDPKISPQIIKLIKSKFQETTDDLKHLKRMRKENINGKNILKVIICPVEGEYSNDDIINLIKETTQLENITLEKKEIPMNKPFDKEINNEWSQKFWPLLWKGNPLVQDLNEIYKKIDIQKVHKYMNQVFELSGDTKAKYPIVTIFVDPLKDEIKSIRVDQRTSIDPIKHSIMDGIAEIAEKELKKRNERKIQDVEANNYLCLNYHVYTSHEPCTMCAMALVHSRISQLVYLKPSLETGGIGKNSGHGEMIHLSCALNWKFESFQYLDDIMFNGIEEIDPTVYI